MADDAQFQSTTPATPPAGTVIAADDVGSKLYQWIKLAYGADDSVTKVSTANPLPVTDAALALLVDTVEALIASTNTKLDTLHADVDGLEGKDYATQTTLAAVLAKLIAAPSTEAKQDAANTLLTAIDGHVDGLEALAALLATAAQIGEVQASPTANTVLDRLKTIGAKDFATQTTLAAIAGSVDQLEGYLDTVESLLAAATPAGTNTIGGVTQGAGPSSATAAGTSVTVGTSSSTLVSANASRKLLVLCNDHATNIVYVRLGASAAVANQGIRLNAAGGSCVIRGDEYTGEVRAIASGASTVVTLSEV